MSERVAGIMRAAGEAGGNVVQAIVLAAGPNRGAALVERIAGHGYAAVLAPDSVAAAELLASGAQYNALVIDAPIPWGVAEALIAHIAAQRLPDARLAAIHLADNVNATADPLPPFAANLLVQSVLTQDLGMALDVAARWMGQSETDVQHQVESIARAVIRLGQRLHRIALESRPDFEATDELDDGAESNAQSILDSAEAIASLRRLIRARRLRERFFQDVRFGEPAWDILLDLSLAWFEDKPVSVSSLCIASGVPMSTAMRWVNEMVDAGLIRRWIDPTDGRRNLVQIAPATRIAMLRYLAAINRIEAAGPPAA